MTGNILKELTYEQWREILRGERLPCAAVHLEAFDSNLDKILESVKGRGKTVRIASKSIRVPGLLDRLLDRGGSLVQGLMCFTVEEAAYLSELGFDNLLVAYPTVQSSDLQLAARMAAKGVDLMLMADSEDHFRAMAAAAGEFDTTIQAVIDVDMSYRPLGQRLHIGVYRSPVRTVKKLLDLAQAAEKLGGVKVVGIMGYEAQIAGLPDQSPFDPELNPAKRLIKRLSIPDVARKRQKAVNSLKALGVELRVVNGGGTGSIKSTPNEDAVTEVTVGSAFYCSQLFSYFADLDLTPSAFFVLQVVRKPEHNIATCLGGGYVASGEAGPDKLPTPYLPRGLKLIKTEGAGEVQTPVILPPKTVGADPRVRPIGTAHANAPGADPRVRPYGLSPGFKLDIGDPVLFRHAKAGELMERFNEVLLVQGGKIIDRLPTYRGLGKAFL